MMRVESMGLTDVKELSVGKDAIENDEGTTGRGLGQRDVFPLKFRNCNKICYLPNWLQEPSHHQESLDGLQFLIAYLWYNFWPDSAFWF